MTDLYSIGMSATRAYGAALRTVGENIANADSPGYTRRSLSLSEAPHAVLGSPLSKARASGDGVIIGAVVRSVDGLRDAALRRANADQGESAARADWYGRIEAALGDGPAGVGAAMSGVYDAATRAAASPRDPARRIDLLTAIDRSAVAFRATAQRLAEVSGDIDAQLNATVEDAKAQLTQLSTVNRGLRAARPDSAARAQLLDQRDALVQNLAEILPIEMTEDAFGGAKLTIAGTDLLDGSTITPLSAARDAAGLVSLTVGATTLSADGGRVGGLTAAAALLSGRQSALDQLSTDWASTLNTWHNNGFTDAGGPGTDLLSSGNAASLSALITDPAALAAAALDGAPGGNLLALETGRSAAGLEQRWQADTSDAAQVTRYALADAEAAQLHRDAAAAARDDVSGVNLDREAAEMLRLQQAYAAAARVLQVARDTVQTIIDIV